MALIFRHELLVHIGTYVYVWVHIGTLCTFGYICVRLGTYRVTYGHICKRIGTYVYVSAHIHTYRYIFIRIGTHVYV